MFMLRRRCAGFSLWSAYLHKVPAYREDTSFRSLGGNKQLNWAAPSARFRKSPLLATVGPDPDFFGYQAGDLLIAHGRASASPYPSVWR